MVTFLISLCFVTCIVTSLDYCSDDPSGNVSPKPWFLKLNPAPTRNSQSSVSQGIAPIAVARPRNNEKSVGAVPAFRCRVYSAMCRA